MQSAIVSVANDQAQSTKRATLDGALYMTISYSGVHETTFILTAAE